MPPVPPVGQEHDLPWDELARTICLQGIELGLDLVGIAPLRTSSQQETLRRHLEALAARGFLSQFLAGPVSQHVDAARVLPSARSLITAAVSYYGPTPPVPPSPPWRGRVARYAWGQDYHPLLRQQLRQLASKLRSLVAAAGGDPQAVQTEVLVDSGTLLDRDAAVAAGLGWIGKNGCLIHPRYGSYLVLGQIVTNLPLPSHTSPLPNRCGSCHRCLDACPTGALVEPGILNANRCLSEWTQRKSLPPEVIRRAMGNMVFGCDICQDVCPWNRKACHGRNTQLQGTDPDVAFPRLDELAAMTGRLFRQRWAGRAAGWRGKWVLARNALIALGNTHAPDALGPLQDAHHHSNPALREAAAWALSAAGRNEPATLLPPLAPAAKTPRSSALAAETPDAGKSGEPPRCPPLPG